MTFLLLANLAGCSTMHGRGSQDSLAQNRSGKSSPSRDQRGKAQPGAARLVEESLHARGIRFGTDGSSQALLAFAQDQFQPVPADKACAGDVVFFDLGGGCGSHAGVVETSEPGGRIGFREWRDGNSRHSYVTPNAPLVRRDDKGRIMNTFLRPKRVDDPPETAYFAGEMLCGVYHVQAP